MSIAAVATSRVVSPPAALAKEAGGFESELRYPGEDDVYENPKMDALGL